MNSDLLYAPILKWKKGEQETLKQLDDKQKKVILPIIELTDYSEPETIIKDLKDCYSYPVYLDTIIADEDDRDFLITIVDEGHKNDIDIYPICYVDDLADLFIKLPDHTNRLGIKIPVPEDIESPTYKNIFSLLKKFQNDYNILLDIILDLDFIEDKKDANRQYRDVKEILNKHLLNEDFYNLVIVSSTSFPENLSSVPAGGKVNYYGFDFLIYKKLSEHFYTTDIKNSLVYSDYGVTKYTGSDIDFSKLRYGILPKVKYTLDESYLVLKGERDHTTRKLIKDYVDLSKEIFESHYYCGENFSFGDLEIKERALGLNKKGPGSNTNWVTISANHHIAVVIEQLSNLP